MTYSQSGPWSSTLYSLVSSVPNHCASLSDTLRENNLDSRAGHLLDTCVYGDNRKESSRNHHFKLKEGFAKLSGGLLFLLHIFKINEHSWPDCQAWLTARAMNFKGRVITPQGWSKLQSPAICHSTFKKRISEPHCGERDMLLPTTAHAGNQHLGQTVLLYGQTKRVRLGQTHRNQRNQHFGFCRIFLSRIFLAKF